MNCLRTYEREGRRRRTAGPMILHERRLMRMIAELGEQELGSDQWGNKASRLSRAAMLGLSVPPGICLCAKVFDSPLAAQALSAWLGTYKPHLVLLRTSSHHEDTAAKA